MVIVGAKGFAKEVLEIFSQHKDLEGIYFYDDVSQDLPEALYGRFSVLKTPADAARIFGQDPRFVLGVGNPKVRRKLAQKMTELGGQLCSSVSPHAFIGAFNNTIGTGVNIMTGSILTNDVVVGEGVLINLNCTVGHDNVLGDYCELSPGVHLSGNVTIGKEVVIGTGAVLLPGVTIGDNSIIGAGSVVNRDVESNVIAVGIPAKVIKTLS